MVSKRSALFNAILAAVKTSGAEMERGDVLAILNEVSNVILMASNREPLAAIADSLKARAPRE